MDDPDTPDTGNPNPDDPKLPIVDMGAYEYDPDDCNDNGIPDMEDLANGKVLVKVSGGDLGRHSAEGGRIAAGGIVPDARWVAEGKNRPSGASVDAEGVAS